MKSIQSIVRVFALFVFGQMALAETILQRPSEGFIAFEGESIFSITNGPPTQWVLTNDAPASGTRAIYQAGDNGTDNSSSFALYSLKFSQPGTYTLYLRWRADAARTSQDMNGANSFRIPITFGDLDTNVANFPISSVNNSRIPPAVNNYAMFRDNITYTVSQAEVDAGTPLIFKIGTREWGMFIDRFVFSTNDVLTEAEFNALPNSETDLIVQGQNDGFVAFEGETITSITNGPPTQWVLTNDAPASGTRALYQAGDNGTDNSSSFALYSLKFSQPGTYSLYMRWRADAARTSQDMNGANSFRIPLTFGDLATNVANFPVSSVNNSRIPPAVNNYAMFRETVATYTVTQAEVDVGTPLIFKIGTREWGMFIDRFVFSTNDVLTEAEFNALPNSGSSTRPAVVRAVGSGTLTNITVSFDKPLAASVNPTNFTLSGGLVVLAATVSSNNAKDIILTTSAQTQGSNYVVTINGVVDASGNAIAPNSRVNFTAWRLAVGWVTRDFYFGIIGGSVVNLMNAPSFPDSPDQTDVVSAFRINNQPAGNDYGARLRAFFTPTNSGVYDLYVYSDDEADIFLSTDRSADNLQFLGTSFCCSANFEAGLLVNSPSLIAGQSYLLQILYKQATGPALLGVAARLQGDLTPPNSLPNLGGSLVSTFINPDLGVVTFTQQPTNYTASAGGRARFTVSATSSGGTVLYQWQKNGGDIPGATRPTYVTPILTSADDGNMYRAIVTVAGNSVPSAAARLTVTGVGLTPPIQPYVGINFVGDGSSGVLHSNDVAGVVAQENFNNIFGNSAAAASLSDQTGAPTPVTITFDPGASELTGTGEQDGDRALLQRYIHNSNTPLTVSLNGVPTGNYNLIVYSVGFNFNTIYHEDFILRGAIDYPTNYVTAQHAGQYLASPGYVRMSSTDPAARQLGNYVQFDNVSPAADGSFTITLEPQVVTPGINFLPAINAIQLVRAAVGPPVGPLLTVTKLPDNNVVISWPATASGFILQSAPTLVTNATWTQVAGSPNPISTAGSITNAPTGTSRFYRLLK